MQVGETMSTRQIHAEKIGFWIVFTVVGVLTYWWLEYRLEPWVIETLCRELVRC